MDKRKNLILIMSCVLAVLVGGLAVMVIIMTTGTDSNEELFQRKMMSANKFVAEEDWDNAIASYLDAISYNDQDEEAYYMLADIYIYRGQMDEAKNILEAGIEKTGSQRLQDMYIQYFGNEDSQKDGENQESGKTDGVRLELNTTLLSQIAKYRLEDYSRKYGMAAVSTMNGQAQVTHKNLSDVLFFYYNTDENNTVINMDTGEPENDKMPCEISFTNISVLFSGFESQIRYEDLEALRLQGLTKKFDRSVNSNVILFEAERCLITVACDENGVIAPDAWNKIVPKYGNEENIAGQQFEIEGIVLNALTGAGIPGGTLYIRAEGDKTGPVLEKVEIDSNGRYETTLEEGTYLAEIESEGFVNEFIEFEIDQWGESSMPQFVVTPELKEGEIRIVLEWGASPSDLDSHLEGQDSRGENIHVFFENEISNAANLDTDDTNSYGPETTTITDIAGSYEFYVIDFTGSGHMNMSGATVKVYVPGRSTPYEYEVPTDLSGNRWDVCKIKNGVVTDY